MIHHVNSRAMSTLSHVLSAISHFHAKNHFESPTVSKSVTRAFEGAKRTFGRPSVSVNIFTHDHLILLSKLAFSSSCSLVNLRTVWRIFIEFFGLLRFNEVANLTFQELLWNPSGFDLFIKKSKTDQHAKGDYVSIVRNTNHVICPVLLTLHYLKKMRIKSGYLLPTIKGKVFCNNAPLCDNTALRELRKCLTKIGIDPSGFGEHSGCRGGTTAAASAGASVNELMLQGRWKSQDMPRLYMDIFRLIINLQTISFSKLFLLLIKAEDMLFPLFLHRRFSSSVHLACIDTPLLVP